MSLMLDRRRLVLGGMLGLGAFSLPGGAALARQMMTATGFTHGVASGEPSATSMLFWTRYVAAAGADQARLDIEVASDREFSRIVTRGTTRTGSYRDWTVKITLDGLEPATSYWFRFIGPDGSSSRVGHVRTLPVGPTERFRIGLFSCSNMPVGWFNAYAHAARRTDVDLWLHVGDYIYEYGVNYQNPDIIADRQLAPAHDHEMISLADYRLRLACYRADEDLQALHAAAAMVCLWDDHESANDSWQGGAQNHQAHEGDWATRRGAAIQAYQEWMPVSEDPWKAYEIGNLTTLYRTESRLIGRTKQADIDGLYRLDSDAAFEPFMADVWQDPTATMLGWEQEKWIATQFAANARKTVWQVVGMATPMGRTLMPQQGVDWLSANASAGAVANMKNAARAARHGLPLWMDRWDGYPQARARFLKAAQQADADLVMLSGDSHNAWAYSLEQDGRPAGVEISSHAVTSNGMETGYAADPAVVARSFIEINPEITWARTTGRGYVMLDITPERIESEWIFMDTVKQRSLSVTHRHRMNIMRGRRQFIEG